ncbi:MAG: hypothetical protein ACXV76_00005, partial [Halobacteriota archaeon]
SRSIKNASEILPRGRCNSKHELASPLQHECDRSSFWRFLFSHVTSARVSDWKGGFITGAENRKD